MSISPPLKPSEARVCLICRDEMSSKCTATLSSPLTDRTARHVLQVTHQDPQMDRLDHKFHFQCLSDWINEAPTWPPKCPHCSREIKVPEHLLIEVLKTRLTTKNFTSLFIQNCIEQAVQLNHQAVILLLRENLPEHYYIECFCQSFINAFQTENTELISSLFNHLDQFPGAAPALLLGSFLEYDNDTKNKLLDDCLRLIENPVSDEITSISYTAVVEKGDFRVAFETLQSSQSIHPSQLLSLIYNFILSRVEPAFHGQQIKALCLKLTLEDQESLFYNLIKRDRSKAEFFLDHCSLPEEHKIFLFTIIAISNQDSERLEQYLQEFEFSLDCLVQIVKESLRSFEEIPSYIFDLIHRIYGNLNDDDKATILYCLKPLNNLRYCLELFNSSRFSSCKTNQRFLYDFLRISLEKGDIQTTQFLIENDRIKDSNHFLDDLLETNNIDLLRSFLQRQKRDEFDDSRFFVKALKSNSPEIACEILKTRKFTTVGRDFFYALDEFHEISQNLEVAELFFRSQSANLSAQFLGCCYDSLKEKQKLISWIPEDLKESIILTWLIEYPADSYINCDKMVQNGSLKISDEFAKAALLTLAKDGKSPFIPTTILHHPGICFKTKKEALEIAQNAHKSGIAHQLERTITTSEWVVDLFSRLNFF